MNDAQKEAKHRAEVMLAFAEGKEIEYLFDGKWHECPEPTFRWDINDYRIKPPAKRKIVLEAWLSNGTKCLHHFEIDPSDPEQKGMLEAGFTRLPGLDLETEIDDE